MCDKAEVKVKEASDNFKSAKMIFNPNKKNWDKKRTSNISRMSFLNNLNILMKTILHLRTFIFFCLYFDDAFVAPRAFCLI